MGCAIGEPLSQGRCRPLWFVGAFEKVRKNRHLWFFLTVRGADFQSVFLEEVLKLRTSKVVGVGDLAGI